MRPKNTTAESDASDPRNQTDTKWQAPFDRLVAQMAASLGRGTPVAERPDGIDPERVTTEDQLPAVNAAVDRDFRAVPDDGFVCHVDSVFCEWSNFAAGNAGEFVARYHVSKIRLAGKNPDGSERREVVANGFCDAVPFLKTHRLVRSQLEILSEELDELEAASELPAA